ncbi:protein of unknown function [Kaistella treverensis]|uniref:DUF4468 domain-containing protein n=1 Tax=Kaistella treverensis TaxID=631455 RepID=A0A1I3P1D1_9FLAO|nr:DUF4468 domain-containing protein [Kaistella treverensis]SFJ15375.1 protein of unknown function [Kaistella treverensis]
MKKFFLFFVFSAGFFSAQEFTNENGVDKFVQVMEVNKSKIDIYKSLKLFLNQSVNKTKFVLDLDDEANGIISFNEHMEPKLVSEYEKGEPNYKVTIEIKENKFRYTASPINIDENLMGMKLQRTMTEFAESKTNDSLIREKEDALKNEKKEKKIVHLNLAISELKAAKDARSKLVEMVKDQLKANVLFVKQVIEKRDEW